MLPQGSDDQAYVDKGLRKSPVATRQFEGQRRRDGTVHKPCAPLIVGQAICRPIDRYDLLVRQWPVGESGHTRSDHLGCARQQIPRGPVTNSATDFDHCDPADVTAVLQDLVTATGCAAHLSSLRGVVYAQASPVGAAGQRPTSGDVPAHRVPSGQVMLAHASTAEADAVLSVDLGTQPHGTSRAQVDRLLSLVRLTGVAVAHTPPPATTIGVAVPVRRADGDVIAALEVQARDFDQMESLLDELTTASDRLSVAVIGYQSG